MITLRTTEYTKQDVIFLYNVMKLGLEHSCVMMRDNIENRYFCDDCENRIACREAQSAMHHLLNILSTNQAKQRKRRKKHC